MTDTTPTTPDEGDAEVEQLAPETDADLETTESESSDDDTPDDDADDAEAPVEEEGRSDPNG